MLNCQHCKRNDIAFGLNLRQNTETAINSTELIPSTPNDFNNNKPSKDKCGKCKKTIPEHLKVINCHACGKYFHVKCCDISKNTYLNLKSSEQSWCCIKCLSNELPYLVLMTMNYI